MDGYLEIWHISFVYWFNIYEKYDRKSTVLKNTPDISVV